MGLAQVTLPESRKAGTSRMPILHAGVIGYYLDLAMRSCRRSKALTALVIVLMGCGVATCMVTYAVFRATSADPIPWKSSQLFVAQIDNFGPVHDWKGEPPNLLSYTDASALRHARQARRQALIYSTTWAVIPGNPQVPAFSQAGDAVTSDFFPMFDVPFRYGGGWTTADDDEHAAVAVISGTLNQKLFGGVNSVGRTINLDQHDYRIVGVLNAWNPRPWFFDVGSAWYPYSHPRHVYIPFSRAVDLHKRASTYMCSADTNDPVFPDWDSFVRSECVWITAWLELPAHADVTRYRQYLRNYAAEQQRIGRFDWPPNVRLSNVMQWLYSGINHVAPDAPKLSMLVALSFLFICLVNVVGLILARFMRRAPEIGVRRALGASRRAIHGQFLVEAAAIGLAGGVLGLLLTILGMAGIGLIFEPQIAALAHLDVSLVLLTVLTSVVTTLAAALYPIWRAAQVQPAWQLKSNG